MDFRDRVRFGYTDPDDPSEAFVCQACHQQVTSEDDSGHTGDCPYWQELGADERDKYLVPLKAWQSGRRPWEERS